MEYIQGEKKVLLEKMYSYAANYRIIKFKLTLRQLNIITSRTYTTFPEGRQFCLIDIVEIEEKEITNG